MINDILNEWLVNESRDYLDQDMNERRLLTENNEHTYIKVLAYAKVHYHNDDIYAEVDDHDVCDDCDGQYPNGDLELMKPCSNKHQKVYFCESCRDEWYEERKAEDEEYVKECIDVIKKDKITLTGTFKDRDDENECDADGWYI